ncbi:MAG: hypothetical protein M0P07_04750 [Candidatus Methanomethylophilaceae archaeon]|nr:hypothetical protein [Candidatus Methanomethylophilaceae archaeon]MDY0246351.1 hypothetical protein [Methanosarcina mazei]
MQSKHVVIIVAIIAIASVACVFLITNNNDSDNDNVSDAVSGTYTYTISGQNDTTNQDYSGSSLIEYKDGVVIGSAENIDTTASDVVLVRPGLTNLDGYDHYVEPLGTSAKIMTLNSILSDCTYGGTKTVTTNYGSMELFKFYKTVAGTTYHYFADNNGVIYKYTMESSSPVDFERTYMLTNFTN